VYAPAPEKCMRRCVRKGSFIKVAQEREVSEMARCGLAKKAGEVAGLDGKIAGVLGRSKGTLEEVDGKVRTLKIQRRDLVWIAAC